MKPRMNYYQAAPETVKALRAVEAQILASGLEKSLIELVKTRASQINGCAYCVDMHVKEARRDGLSEQWINLISTWHEAQVYSDAERAVLGWTDALTLVAQTRAPDADYETLRAHFSEADIAKMIVIIGTINLWNRIAIGSRSAHPVDAGAKAA